LVDSGNIVHAADTNPLVIVSQIQPISIVFTISEDHIAQIMTSLARDPHLPVEAWDRALTGKIASGTLLAMDNQIDQTNGNVKIKAIFANSKFELFPNLFVNARLLTDTLKNVTIVPAAAVQRGPANATFVYVVVNAPPKPPTADQAKDDQPKTDPTTGGPPKAAKVVEIRPVTIGPSEGDSTVIESGLAPGEIVVTDGVDKLQNGTQVSLRDRAKKPSATQPGATQPSRDGGTTPTTQAGEAATQPAGERHHHSKKGDGE
jgi:multidrug efflux system membrane fusion protein